MTTRVLVSGGRPYAGFWLRSVAAICVAIGSLVLMSAGACRRGGASIDTAPRPGTDGTLTGNILSSEGKTGLEGRAVEVINVDTGDRQHGTTNNAGSFSFRLKPGKYRVELALRHGESLVREPGIIDLNRVDIDAHADFVVGTVRVSRPRGPAYRIDDGLGSPIA